MPRAALLLAVGATAAASVLAAPATAGPASCRSADFSVRSSAGDGAAQHLIYTLTATSRRSTACVVHGYFDLTAYDERGGRIPTTSHHHERQPEPLLVLPGRAVQLTVETQSSVDGAHTTCRQARTLRLAAPGDGASASFAANRFVTCGQPRSVYLSAASTA